MSHLLSIHVLPGAAGQTFSPATAAPIIATQPTNQAGLTGQAVTFTAAAVGTAAPAVQWQVSTNGGLSFTNLSDGHGVSGASTMRLTLSGLTATLNNNRYRAVFTNAAGSTISTAAVLSVS